MADNFYALVNGIKAMRDLLKKGKPLSYSSFFDSVSWKYLVFKDGVFKRLAIYRATFIKEEELKVPLTKYRFSYPSPKRGVQVKRGRGNIEGFPAFYGTTNFLGSILEIILTESDSKSESIPGSVYVSEWELMRPTSLRVHDLMEYLDYDPRNNISYEELNALNMYLKHVAMCFRSKHAYDFSSQYSHNFLVGVSDKKGGYIKWLENPVEVIQYPSVIKDAGFVNYAIHPDAFDSKFTFNRVFKLELPSEINKERIVNGLLLRPVEVGRVDPASVEPIINWGALTSIDHLFFEKISNK